MRRIDNVDALYGMAGHAESDLVPWTDLDAGIEYLLDIAFAVLDGRAEVVAFRVYSRGYAVPLTASLLNRVPFARLAAQQCADHAKLVPATAELFAPRRSGRALTDAMLADLARVYRAAVAHHVPPNKAIAEVLGISYSAATKRTAAARARGFLPPVERTDRVSP